MAKALLFPFYILLLLTVLPNITFGQAVKFEVSDRQADEVIDSYTKVLNQVSFVNAVLEFDPETPHEVVDGLSSRMVEVELRFDEAEKAVENYKNPPGPSTNSFANIALEKINQLEKEVEPICHSLERIASEELLLEHGFLNKD